MSHVRLLRTASKVRLLLVVLTALGVVWLAQGAAPSAAFPPSAAAPTPAPQPLYLPHVTRGAETLPHFQPVASPTFGSEVAHLEAVDLLNDHDGWAVGDYGRRDASLILRWDGANWTPVPSPNLDNSSLNLLTDVVAITPTDAWALVYGEPPSLLHWDGQAWSIVPGGPGLERGSIQSLAASGPHDVWAAGSIHLNEPVDHEETLMLHWDGARWSRVPSPSPGAVFNSLRDIVARAPNDAWAIGKWSSFHQGGYDQPLLLHWDGEAWRETTPPILQGSVASIASLTALAADDAWIVGYSGSLYPRPLTLHWNGTAWTEIAVPLADGAEASLYKVAALAPNNVLALGGLRTAAGAYSFWLLRWNGAAWTTVDLPSLTGRLTLTDLAVAAPGTVMIVGYQENADRSVHPWSLHWNGTAWREPSHPPLIMPHNWLNDIAAVSPTDIWAVGNYEDVAEAYYGALLLHWDGQAWTRVLSSRFDHEGDLLFALAALSSADVWAVGVGYDSESPLIIHWDGQRWRSVSHPGELGRLNAVAGRTSDDVWAVGYEESDTDHVPLILHWDGQVWAVQSAPPLHSDNARLYDVAPLARDNVWAVGYETSPDGDLDRPLILHWDGGQWTKVAAPALEPVDASLSCVTALAPDNVWAVGSLYRHMTSEGFALHWDGVAWTQARSLGLNAFSSRLNDCLALSAHEVYAVGWLQATANGPTESLVLRWDGTRWTRLASANPGGQTDRLAAVAVAGDSLWTVGSSAQPGWPRQAGQILVERAHRGAYPTTRP